MHKYVSMILAIVLVIALAVPAAAAPAPKSVYIESLDLNMVVPDQYTVMTPDMPDNDPAFKQMKIDVPKFKKWAESNDVAVWVLRKDGGANFTITTTVLEDDEDFLDCDPEYIENTAEMVKDEWGSDNVKIKDAGVHKDGDVPYVFARYSNKEEKTDNITMFTVIDLYDEDDNVEHMKYDVNFTSHKPIDEKTEKMVVEFVNSINWAVYANPYTRVIFNPDSAWAHSPAQEKELDGAWYITSKDKEPLSAISYSFSDLYEQAGGEDSGMDREDVNLDMFSAEDVAEMFEAKKADVKSVKYNDVEYYQVSNLKVNDNPQASITVTVTMNNGYMHMFMNTETKKGSNTEAFENLMETVVFAD